MVEHFSVDGTLLEAWVSLRGVRPRDEERDPPAGAGGWLKTVGAGDSCATAACPATASGRRGLSRTQPRAHGAAYVPATISGGSQMEVRRRRGSWTKHFIGHRLPNHRDRNNPCHPEITADGRPPTLRGVSSPVPPRLGDSCRHLQLNWQVRGPAPPLDFSNPDALRRSLERGGLLYDTYWVRFGRGRTTFDQAVEHTRLLYGGSSVG